MTQQELNEKFAKAYGVYAEREIPTGFNAEGLAHFNVEYTTITIPINTDTLTLFQLCIANNIDFSINTNAVSCFVSYRYIHCTEKVKDHATKEKATCAAMWDALCKLKAIE